MKKITNKEHHENGALSYIEEIIILSSGVNNENARIHPDGYQWIRVGLQAKYHDNGQVNWQLNYDENGKVIKSNHVHYRKDGTVIVF